jgi:hypothetical protein
VDLDSIQALQTERHHDRSIEITDLNEFVLTSGEVKTDVVLVVS